MVTRQGFPFSLSLSILYWGKGLDYPTNETLFCGFSHQVHSIRDAAANNLKRLAEEFGPEWAMQHIVPQVCLQSLQHRKN